MSKHVLIYSGGMDSTVLLYHLVANHGRGNVECLSFNYGSKHNDAEFKIAKYVTSKLGLKHKRIDMTFINNLFKSDLLSSGGDIPEGHYAESNMKRTVVPFRNGIMLSIACGYADSVGAKYVAIGNHAGDHAIYPDCRGTFINSMNEAMAYGTYGSINIASPFCGKTKTDIVTLGDRMGIDFTKTYSCYKGGDVHCGRCSTCFERREAFYEARVDDPTEYIDKTDIKDLIKEYELKE